MAGALKVRVGTEWKTAGAGGGGTTEAFIVIGNGTNQTTALQTALNNARDSTTIKTVRIHGTVLVDAHSTGQASLLVVETGVTLEGVGYSSCIKLRPESFVQNPVGQNVYNWGIVYRANAALRNFRVDGSRGAIASGAWTEYATNAIAGDWTTPRTGVVFDHLWIHDVGGKVKESFAISCGGGETNIKGSYLWTWNNDGSGVALNGTSPTGTWGQRADISHLYAWNNGWMGLTSWGFQNARISDSHAWNNSINGFNAEWSAEIDYFDCVSHHNGGAGFGGYGKMNSIRYHNPVSYSNVTNAAESYKGEFTFFGNTSGAVVSMPGQIDIIGGSVRPAAGRPHIWYAIEAGATDTPSYPNIRIAHPEGHTWTISNAQSGNRTVGISYYDQPTIRPVHTGPISGWVDGGVSSAAYAGAGIEGTTPVTITATAQWTNRRSLYVLQPNRRYLVTLRGQTAYANRPWYLEATNAAGTSVAGTIYLGDQPAGDVGRWVTLGAVVTVSSAGPARLGLVNGYAGANSLVIDWLTVYELPSVSASSGVMPAVTGSRGGNAALASLLTQLAAQGIIVDSTTA